jgi:hypothetical protein
LSQNIAQRDAQYAVLNAGVSGSDPFFNFKMLQHIAEIYEVKQAVFMINESDVNDVLCRGGMERFRENGALAFRPSPWWEPCYAYSFVFRLYMHSIYKIGWSLYTPEREFEMKKQAINTLADLFSSHIVPWAAKRNVKVIVVLQPMRSDAEHTSEIYAQMQANFTSINGLKYVDLLPELKHLGNMEQQYWEIDGHFRPIGYANVANIIYEKLML